MLLPPLESTHRPSPKPRLRLKPKLRPKSLPNPELVLLPLLVLRPLLELEPTPLPAQTHNTLRNRNSMEASPLTYFHRELALNARLVRPPRCNIPVLWLLMVKYSILPSQEASQLPSLLVT